MTAAIVLAAGGSSRMGRPKQLVRLAGETLLERALRTARAAGCSPVVVVLGAHADRIAAECRLESAIVVHNPAWREGMASSLRAGLQAVQNAEGVVVLACDQPATTAAHLRALMTEPGQTRASAYASRKGVPTYFPAACFAELLQLQGDEGARGLLRGADAVELPGGELDVDTEESYALAAQRFGAAARCSGADA